MPREIRAIFVASASAQPEVKCVPPLALEYERLFKHRGLYVKLVLPSMGSAYGEMLYCVSDARHKGLPLTRTLHLPGYEYPVYGPFMLVGVGTDEEISLSDARIEHWLARLRVIFN